MIPEIQCVQEAIDFRAILLDTENKLRVSIAQLKKTGDYLHDQGECIAQAMLALRHIEDARMRMGKVIQYATTGVSNNPE